MKLQIILLLFILSLFSGCVTNTINKTETVEKPAVPEKIDQPNPLEEQKIEDNKIVEEKTDVNEEEYLRSINNLDQKDTVTKEEFSEDKKAILLIIEELSKIMATQDVDAWLKYIEPSSIDYYKNQVNLQKAQSKLPNKATKLYSINDYFKYVFIPSRKRSKVDEIRYISKTSIKAVQVKDDKSIVVYYYFTKINDKWLVHLPPLS